MTARGRKKSFLRETFTVTIERLGGGGDGIATLVSPETQIPRRVFIPYTLPGETVIAESFERNSEGLRARLLEILIPASNRVEPQCQHFSRCGGCALQHLSPAEQAQFKTDKILNGLVYRGWSREQVAILPIQTSAAGERRRAVFTAKRAYLDQGGEVSIGFNQKSAHRIVELAECPILLPQLFDLVSSLHSVLKPCLNFGTSADILTTATDSGIEMVIRAHDRLKGGQKKPSPVLCPAAQEALLGFAARHQLARLIWHSAGHRPQILYGESPPPG